MLTFVVEQGRYRLSNELIDTKNQGLRSNETLKDVAIGGKNFVPNSKYKMCFSNPVVYHVTVYDGESDPVAYLSRDSYKEAVEAGEKYCSRKTRQV